jgi:hypothetical protein
MSKYVAVLPYGSEGTKPLNNHSCPMFLANGYEVTCVSGSGGSICSGFWGHVSDDVVECVVGCQESSKKAEND